MEHNDDLDLCVCGHDGTDHGDGPCHHDGAFENTVCSCPSFEAAQ